jgi:hypothetical protein
MLGKKEDIRGPFRFLFRGCNTPLPTGHALEDQVFFLHHILAVVGGAMAQGAGDDGGQTGGFIRGELRGGFLKVALCCGLDAEYPVAPFDAVQIQLQDAAFAQPQLHEPGQDQFLYGRHWFALDWTK